MKTKLIIILFTSLLGCDQCDHDPPLTELEKLPPATQEGKNTFGCLVNGKAWVTKTSIDANAVLQSGLLQISADVDGFEIDQNIKLFLRQPIEIGLTYSLVKTTNAWSNFIWARPDAICWYDSQNTTNGTVVITNLDNSKLLVSGEFKFTTALPMCDTIRVTDGRFDLTYAN